MLPLLLSCALQIEPFEPIRTVEVGKNRELRVNGKPFFPIMSWLQRPTRYGLLARLGFNTFCGGRAGEGLESAARAGGYLMSPLDDKSKGHERVLAYTHGDEPDLGIDKGKPRRAAEQVVENYKKVRASDAGRPVFLNLTGAFMANGPGAGRGTEEARQAYYTAVMGGADLLCFDVYPIYGWNRPDKIAWVADGVRDLRAYAGTKPILAWIESCKGSQWIDYDRQKDVLPEHTRAEVWMAIIRGATGIGYFTHAWRPKFTEFNPTDDMQAELKRLNAQVTRLAPAILSDPAKIAVSMKMGDLPCDVLGKDHEGQVYLFAVSLDVKQGGTATFTVPGLKKGAGIEVIDEGRSLTAEEGAFTDEFKSLAVHLYRLKP